MALRLAPRAGIEGGAAVQRVPAAAGLGELGGARLSAAQRPARVGIFGGSFDPVHNAHVALARVALAGLRLDELLWVPA
ncbi:MAG TPA: hypothetical protein VGM74_21340, partial [Burkholderiaceae bacterium]